MAFFINPPEMSIAPRIGFGHNPNLSKFHSFKPFMTGKASGSSRLGLRVCGGEVKDCGVLDLEQNLFSAPVVGRESKEEEEKQSCYVNMGYAIRTLREDFPRLFLCEPTFDIYRDDVVFKDPLNTFTGIKNYKLIFWALRFHGRIFFKSLWVDLISVWQPDENVIMVRWTVHGIPRVPWECHGRFSGTLSINLTRKARFLSTGLIILRRINLFSLKCSVWKN